MTIVEMFVLAPLMRRGRQAPVGFTLIELVLALTLLMGVLLAQSLATKNFRGGVGEAKAHSRVHARSDTAHRASY